MSIDKTKTGSGSRSKPSRVNVTRGAAAEKEMAKMQKESGATGPGDLRGTIRAAAKSSAKGR